MRKWFLIIWNKKGSVSVFTVCVLLAVCVLSLVLLDYSRALLYKHDISSRLKLATKSVMSYYDSVLAERYGLYGINYPFDSDIKDIFYEYFSECTYKNDERVNFYAYETVKHDLVLDESLSEPTVLSKQINGIMKYKSTANLIEYVVSLFKTAKEAEETKYTYVTCAECAKILRNTESIVKQLKSLTEGHFPGDRLCVNGIKYIDLTQLLSDALENKKDEKKAYKMVLDVLKQYKEYHNHALLKCNELNEMIFEIDVKISEIDRMLEDNPQLSATFDETLLELKKARNSISNMTVNTYLTGNVIILNSMIENIRRIQEEDGTLQDIKAVLDEKEKLKTDLTVTYLMAETDTSFSALDSRKETEKIYNDAATGVDEDDSQGHIPDNIYQTLPSYLHELANQLPVEEMDTVDLNNIDSISGMLGGSLFENIKELGKQIADTAFCDDYVLTFFSNRLSESSYMPLRSEAEYIIAGHKTDKENNKIVRNKIFLLRFILNIIHVFGDGDKRALAESIGNSIAAACSYGTMGPVFTLLIIAGWALAESVYDINALLEGEEVPLIKKKKDWKLSIEGLGADNIKGEDSSEDNIVDKVNGFGYTEYLRVLLLMTNLDTKLIRVADILEINMSKITGRRYRLSGIYNKVVSTVVIDMNLYAGDLLGASKEKYYKEERCALSYS